MIGIFPISTTSESIWSSFFTVNSRVIGAEYVKRLNFACAGITNEVLPSASVICGLPTFIFPSLISNSSLSIVSEISLTISCILCSIKLLKEVILDSTKECSFRYFFTTKCLLFIYKLNYSSKISISFFSPF